jgi:hypothetical protein
VQPGRVIAGSFLLAIVVCRTVILITGRVRDVDRVVTLP